MQCNLGDVATFIDGEKMHVSVSSKTTLKDQLELGREELTRNHREEVNYSLSLSARGEELRWFVLPQEIELAM